ncbi:chlorohydrolase [Streptococcus pneumoniae]|nr:hypothetical protein [Streptococcus pneumoniae]SNK45954.1 chlorohydrolase [Streptococcus pneumoniae]
MKLTKSAQNQFKVSSKHRFEVADRTDEVSNIYTAKVKLTGFKEIFEKY